MITDKQAIEAIKTIKEFCEQISGDDCRNGKCPIGIWCKNHVRDDVPEEWKESWIKEREQE